jgi:hypothetical protein
MSQAMAIRMNPFRFVTLLRVLALRLCVPPSILAKKSISHYQMRFHSYETHWDRVGYAYPRLRACESV